MSFGCYAWTGLQLLTAFVTGWGIRGRCKVDLDYDSGPEPLLTRLIRVVTG